MRVFEVTLTGPGGGVTSIVRELQSPQEFVVALAPSDTTGRTLAIVPTKPLKQLTSYMAVLLGNGGVATPGSGPSITDANGNDITPDTPYFLAKRTSPLCVNNASTDPLLPTAQACALEPLRQLTNSQEAAAASAGIDPSRVALSWVMTTQSITPEMQAIESRAEHSDTPSLTVAFTTLNLGSLNEGLPPIADIYVGTLNNDPYYLTVPSAADPTAPLHDYWKAAPGGYVPPFNAVGLDPTSTNVTFANPLPVANSLQRIPVIMTIPNANSGKSKPSAGWPVVIFQHGITRNRTDMLAIAGALAQVGYAVVAIDAPLHGVTDKTSPFYRNQLIGSGAPSLVVGERTFDVDYSSNTSGAPGPDGQIDGSGNYFINLSSLLTSRDNLRQANADLLELTQAIVSGSVAGADLDGSTVEFVGQSLGSIIGTAYMAIEPQRACRRAQCAGWRCGASARCVAGVRSVDPRRSRASGTDTRHDSIRRLLRRCANRCGFRRFDQLRRVHRRQGDPRAGSGRRCDASAGSGHPEFRAGCAVVGHRSADRRARSDDDHADDASGADPRRHALHAGRARIAARSDELAASHAGDADGNGEHDLFARSAGDRRDSVRAQAVNGQGEQSS